MKEYKNVLVPYDKSDSARRALAKAVDIIEGVDGAQLHVLHVADVSNFDFMVKAQAEMDRSKANAVAMRDEFVKALSDDIKRDVAPYVDSVSDKVTFDFMTGKPSTCIVNFSESNKCDLICMGCRGINAVAGVVGSVSYGVLRAADTDVLIIK